MNKKNNITIKQSCREAQIYHAAINFSCQGERSRSNKPTFIPFSETRYISISTGQFFHGQLIAH